jgi:hypothetical protein
VAWIVVRIVLFLQILVDCDVMLGRSVFGFDRV